MKARFYKRCGVFGKKWDSTRLWGRIRFGTLDWVTDKNEATLICGETLQDIKNILKPYCIYGIKNVKIEVEE